MCWWNINNNISFHFRLFPRKTNLTKFFIKIQTTLLWAHSGPFFPKFGQKIIFLEKSTPSVFKYSNYLPLCQKSVKPNEPFLRKLLDEYTKNQFIPLKIPTIWLTKSILGHISGTRIFPNMYFVQAYSN